MAKLLVMVTLATITPRANFQACFPSILFFTPNQTEYFHGDRVNATCLQSCKTSPLFCQPSLFYATREIRIFPQTSETEIRVTNCRYYRYNLVNLNTTDLTGHNISCGWRLGNGSYSLSYPLRIIVKLVEVHTANCTTGGTLKISCTHPAVPSNVSLVVNGATKFSVQSSTGVTYFSLPYNNGTKTSTSCRVDHNSSIHTSVPVTLQPVRPCRSEPFGEARSQIAWVALPTVILLGILIGASLLAVCVLRVRLKSHTTDTQTKNCTVERTQVQAINFRVSEENVVSTDCNDEAHHSPIKMELKPSYAALAEVRMTDTHTDIDGNIDGHSDGEHHNPIAMEVNPSYAALTEVQMLDSNIIDGRNNADYDSPITMAVNPSYMAFTEVQMADRNDDIDGNDETGHDGPGAITMEANPSYMPLAELYTQDSSFSAANVHLQQNPSYVALPMTISQGQDFLVCASPPVSRSTAACTLSQHRALPLPDEHPP